MWQILADFVADSVADTKKSLENQGVMRSLGRCGRDSMTHINIMIPILLSSFNIFGTKKHPHQKNDGGVYGGEK